MPTDLEYYITLCKLTQLFYYLRKHYKITQQIAKSGAPGGSAVFTGRPEIKQPLEATVKNRLERELGEDLPPVILHRGGNNEPFLNMAAVFALTIGNDVFIREKSYKEGNLETDKILLHEMVHVLQNKHNVKIKTKDERNRAEAEAEQAENDVYGDIWAEQAEVIDFHGEKIRMTPKEKAILIERTVQSILQWIADQKHILPEDKYFKFLIGLDDFRKRFPQRTSKSAYHAILYDIENKLRASLC